MSPRCRRVRVIPTMKKKLPTWSHTFCVSCKFQSRHSSWWGKKSYTSNTWEEDFILCLFGCTGWPVISFFFIPGLRPPLSLRFLPTALPGFQWNNELKLAWVDGCECALVPVAPVVWWARQGLERELGDRLLLLLCIPEERSVVTCTESLPAFLN